MNDDDKYAYPSIGSLAVIGDGRSLALLDSFGCIQWYCPIRFDNPPLVWSLLDRQRGGCVGLDVGDARPTMSYVPETGVVRYEWSTDTGHARATVAMPLGAGPEHQEVLWYLEGLDGSLHVDFVFDPRPDFAHEGPKIERGRDAITMHSDSFSAAITGSGLFHPADRGIRASTQLAAGQHCVRHPDVATARCRFARIGTVASETGHRSDDRRVA